MGKLKTSIPANVCFTGQGDKYIEAIIVDLGLDGVRLKVNTSNIQNVAAEDICKLEFVFLDTVLVGVDCIARNVSTVDSLYLIGMEISCPIDDVHKELEKLME